MIGKGPQEYVAHERPLIVVFLHGGAFSIIRNLERSRGVAAATYGHVHKSRLSLQKVFRMGDRRYGLKEIPDHIHIKLRNKRGLVKFVEKGRLLCMALDGAYDQWSKPIEVDGVTLHLKDGAVKLAKSKGAILIPAWVNQNGAFNFEVTYGEPVPDSMLQKNEDTRTALTYLARQLWDQAKANPEAISWTILESIAPGKKMLRSAWP